MLSQLPHEIRLNIFRHVFANVQCQGVIRVKDTAKGIRFKFEKEHDSDICSGAVSCMNPTIMGEGVAAAAAEALYQSEFIFRVGADICSTFLQTCPLSNAVQPGRYIKMLKIYMDEDPNFIGDGKYGQDLRKADWVDLVPGPGDDRITRSTKRTHLMRRCWRAILNMPKLQTFEFWIMPARGKVPADDIQFEIRDIIPMHYRLFCRSVDAKIYLRTWEVHESFLDISTCIPYKWTHPMFTEVEITAARARMSRKDPLDLIWFFRTQALHNYAAFRHYHCRLVADRSQCLLQNFDCEMVADKL